MKQRVKERQLFLSNSWKYMGINRKIDNIIVYQKVFRILGAPITFILTVSKCQFSRVYKTRMLNVKHTKFRSSLYM